MDAWLSQLRDDLRAIEHAGLWRALRAVEPAGLIVLRDGRELINLASNDYLALATHDKLKTAAVEAVERYGVGAGASRLVTGHQPIHEQVEARFARFKHAESALLFPTGYMANLAVLTTLAQWGDLICIDKLCHASLIDAARASGATVRVFPHLGYDKLERLLERGEARLTGDREAGGGAQVGAEESRGGARRKFIVTDSVFSMDGDCADLPALCELADRYDAITVVDEAHATGVLGESGAGLCEAQVVGDRVDIVVSTASKALGGLGGIVTSRREVIDTLINKARPFIYTTGVPPAQAAVIDAALDVVRDEPWRRQRVLALAGRLQDGLCAIGLDTTGARSANSFVTPIVLVVAGSPQSAVELSDHLRRAGFHTPAIRPPTVAPGAARVRIGLRADLDDDCVDRLLTAVRDWFRRADVSADA